MAEPGKLSDPVLGTGAGFHADQAKMAMSSSSLARGTSGRSSAGCLTRRRHGLQRGS
jgi:hypothetical protein